MRQPDADTNGRNLRFVMVAEPGLPSEIAGDIGVFLTPCRAGWSASRSAARSNPSTGSH